MSQSCPSCKRSVYPIFERGCEVCDYPLDDMNGEYYRWDGSAWVAKGTGPSRASGERNDELERMFAEYSKLYGEHSILLEEHKRVSARCRQLEQQQAALEVAGGAVSYPAALRAARMNGFEFGVKAKRAADLAACRRQLGYEPDFIDEAADWSSVLEG